MDKFSIPPLTLPQIILGFASSSSFKISTSCRESSSSFFSLSQKKAITIRPFSSVKVIPRFSPSTIPRQIWRMVCIRKFRLSESSSPCTWGIKRPVLISLSPSKWNSSRNAGRFSFASGFAEIKRRINLSSSICCLTPFVLLTVWLSSRRLLIASSSPTCFSMLLFSSFSSIGFKRKSCTRSCSASLAYSKRS